MTGAVRGRGRRDLLVVAALVLALAGGGPAGAAAWSVKTVARGTGSAAGCVAESDEQSLSDGYQTTTAHLTVDQRSVAVASASNLDGGFSDIGLAVDGSELVLMDGLADPRRAVFDSKHAELVPRFKAGARVRVQLRFWPEWPATGPHSATFSLDGFTRAYEALAGCR